MREKYCLSWNKKYIFSVSELEIKPALSGDQFNYIDSHPSRFLRSRSFPLLVIREKVGVNPFHSGTSKTTLQARFTVCESHLGYLEKAVFLSSLESESIWQIKHINENISNQICVDFCVHSINTHSHARGVTQRILKNRKAMALESALQPTPPVHLPKLSLQQAILQLSYKHLKPRVISIMEILTLINWRNTDGSGVFSKNMMSFLVGSQEALLG